MFVVSLSDDLQHKLRVHHCWFCWISVAFDTINCNTCLGFLARMQLGDSVFAVVCL